MIRRDRFLTLFLVLILMMPVFAVNISANNLSPKQQAVNSSVFIDYVTEKIWVIPPDASTRPTANIITTSEASKVASNAAKAAAASTPRYMYALRAVTDSQVFRDQDRRVTALAREKWFPIYGGGIDIAKVIPTNVNRPYAIAIREASDIFNNVTGFDSRVSFIISPRYNQKNFSKALAYDAINERIMFSQEAPSYFTSVVYQFDLFPPRATTLNKLATANTKNNLNGIKVDAEHFSLGTVVNISSAPGTYNNTFFARSKNIRFKVPRRPNAPTAKVDSSGTNRRIQNMRATFEYSFDFIEDPADSGNWIENPNGVTWRSYQGAATRNFTTDDIAAVFPGITILSTSSEGAVYRVWVRVAPVTTPANRRAPASLTTLLEIPVSWFEN